MASVSVVVDSVVVVAVAVVVVVVRVVVVDVAVVDDTVVVLEHGGSFIHFPVFLFLTRM